MGIFAYKAAITKTKSATTSAFFFSSSFPSPRSFFFSFPFVIVILELYLTPFYSSDCKLSKNPLDIQWRTNINHKGLQRTANEYAEERRIYKDLISKKEK